MTLDSRHIRAGRALIDATQEDMAHAAGLSLATLNNIERNVARPRAKTYNKISQALADAGVRIHANDSVEKVEFQAEGYLEEEIGTALRDTLTRLISKKNMLDVQRAVFFSYATDRQRAALYLEGKYRRLIYKGGILDTQHRIGLAELSVFVISCRKELGANMTFATEPLSEVGITDAASEFVQIAEAECNADLLGYLGQFTHSQDSIAAAKNAQDHPLFHVLKIFQ